MYEYARTDMPISMINPAKVMTAAMMMLLLRPVLGK